MPIGILANFLSQKNWSFAIILFLKVRFNTKFIFLYSSDASNVAKANIAALDLQGASRGRAFRPKLLPVIKGRQGPNRGHYLKPWPRSGPRPWAVAHGLNLSLHHGGDLTLWCFAQVAPRSYGISRSRGSPEAQWIGRHQGPRGQTQYVGWRG